MKTTHKHYICNAAKMAAVADRSVNLVVTSPPYPMIDMWDEIFSHQDRKIEKALKKPDGALAFERMHQVLDRVWKEMYRVLSPGGFACINIGDATRTLGNNFALYPNHARILNATQAFGFTALPCILWRKQTNAPNKFMGSGMLPAGAYVTLEHEYILILRKGDKREFGVSGEKAERRRSALFWEERNQWFSDVWMDLKGARQEMLDKKVRNRSGAFPFELPYRLINMYSVAGDRVLDPFLGAGTTMIAAMVAARHSIGFELEADFLQQARQTVDHLVAFGNQVISERLARHAAFVDERAAAGKEIKHTSRLYGFPVVTGQETDICFYRPSLVDAGDEGRFTVSYQTKPTVEPHHPCCPKQQELF